MKTVSTAVVLAAAAVSLTGCATESSRSLEVEPAFPAKRIT